MKAAALLSLVLLLGGSERALASARVPQLNVEAMCKATTAADKEMGIVLAQNFKNCMRGETTA